MPLQREVLVVVSRFLRWAFTGGMTFVVEATVFWLCFQPSQSVLIANAVALPLATMFNYAMHHRFSFKSERAHLLALRWYGVALAVAYIVNSLLVQTFINLGAEPVMAKVIAIPIQAPASFMFLNYVVFRPPRLSQQDI